MILLILIPISTWRQIWAKQSDFVKLCFKFPWGTFQLCLRLGFLKDAGMIQFKIVWWHLTGPGLTFLIVYGQAISSVNCLGPRLFNASVSAHLVFARPIPWCPPCPWELWPSSPSLLGMAKFRSAAMVFFVSILIENKAIFSHRIEFWRPINVLLIS